MWIIYIKTYREAHKVWDKHYNIFPDVWLSVLKSGEAAVRTVMVVGFAAPEFPL